MKEIGSKLREAREKRNLSVQDVSNAIKINSKIIQSLEDGEVGHLPAKPFLRGFIQTYAKYLDLNVDDMMKQFLEIQGTTRPRPMTNEEPTQHEQSNHEVIQKRVELYKKVAYSVAALFAIVLIYVIHRIVSRYENESKKARENKEVVKSQLGAPNDAPATDASTTAVAVPLTAAVTSPVVGSTATTTPAATTPTPPVTPPPVTPVPETHTTPVSKPVEAKKEEPKKVEEKKKPEEPKKVEEKKPEDKKAEEKKPDDKKTEDKKVEDKKTKSQEIIIEALDNVEVTYTKDSDGEKTVHLKPEQVLNIKASSKVTVNISDSGAVNVTHNGRDAGVPGSLGESIRLSYP